MKFVTKTLLLSNALSASVAFAPPRPQPQYKQHNNFQQQLLPDPSTLESATLFTADAVQTAETVLGSLALLGSVGYGVMTGMKDEDWDYEYKAGNEEAMTKYGDAPKDLAIIGVSPEEVAEDMAKGQVEVTEAQKEFFGKEDEGGVTEAQKSFFGKVKDKVVPSVPAPAPAPAAPVETAPKTSDTVLKATEKAKDEVKKKGVEETKQKMNSKSTATTTTDTDTSTPPPSPASEEPETTTEVTKKEKGTKRKLAKGATLIVAAGVVAVARNVVKAWLGRGML